MIRLVLDKQVVTYVSVQVYQSVVLGYFFDKKRSVPVGHVVLAFKVFDDGFLFKASSLQALALSVKGFGFTVFGLYRRVESLDEICKSKRWKNQ